MEEINPYAAPSIPANAEDTLRGELARRGGCWRHKQTVVTTLAGQLPAYCVKTGEPAIHFQAMKLTWYAWWVLPVSILLGPLFFLPLIKAGRRVRVSVGMGPTCMRRRYRALFLVPLGVVAAALLFATAFRDDLGQSVRSPLVMAGIFLLTTSVIGGLRTWLPPLTVLRVDDHFVWLLGADERFLSALPQWPLK
jgi:hypothetical protein